MDMTRIEVGMGRLPTDGWCGDGPGIGPGRRLLLPSFLTKAVTEAPPGRYVVAGGAWAAGCGGTPWKAGCC